VTSTRFLCGRTFGLDTNVFVWPSCLELLQLSQVPQSRTSYLEQILVDQLSSGSGRVLKKTQTTDDNQGTSCIIRSTFRQSWPNKAGLKCLFVPHTYVRMSVRPSTKSFFDFNEIWHVGSGRWVMHDSMQYDPIQGQGHETFRFGNPAVFKSYFLRHLQWKLAADHAFSN